MTVAALMCVVFPLARKRSRGPALDTQQTNLSILRDQLAEMKGDLERDTISTLQFDVARAELERRVLEETAAASRPGVGGKASGRKSAIALGVLIPLAAISLYGWIGDPGGLREEVRAGEERAAPADVEEMVARLASKLEKNPNDARAWMLLGRSYYVMQRMDEAVAAYAKAAAKINDDADLYADFADALAMSQGRNLRGKPLELVNRALAINPSQPKALAMAGTEAFDRRDFPAAIGFWERLQPLLPPDSEIAKAIAVSIAEARELGGNLTAQNPLKGGKTAPKVADKAVSSGSVSGQVTLSPALAAKVNPGETLFVVARAVNGPRIPLAVIRKNVADLPLDFTLDDSLAMSPELKLSGVPEVVVTARISKTGNAISQSGDLQGVSPPVKVGARGLRIVIDAVVP